MTDDQDADRRNRRDDLLLEHQLCFALTVASRSVVGAYKPVLDKLGLTHPQYLVMLCLWESSPRSVRDISDALAQEPATISPLLRRPGSGRATSPGSAADGNERTLAVATDPARRRAAAAGDGRARHHDGPAGPDPGTGRPPACLHDGADCRHPGGRDGTTA